MTLMVVITFQVVSTQFTAQRSLAAQSPWEFWFQVVSTQFTAQRSLAAQSQWEFGFQVISTTLNHHKVPVPGGFDAVYRAAQPRGSTTLGIRSLSGVEMTGLAEITFQVVSTQFTAQRSLAAQSPWEFCFQVISTPLNHR
jgi:hypothetical protein